MQIDSNFFSLQYRVLAFEAAVANSVDRFASDVQKVTYYV